MSDLTFYRLCLLGCILLVLAVSAGALTARRDSTRTIGLLVAVLLLFGGAGTFAPLVLEAASR